MFSFIKNHMEKKQLKNAFKEVAALSSWTLITLIELNEDYFFDHEEKMNFAKESFEKGMKFSEINNYRMAYNSVIYGIDTLIADNRNLIIPHHKLTDALNRIRKLDNEVISPLWEKHGGGNVSKTALSSLTKIAVKELENARVVDLVVMDIQNLNEATKAMIVCTGTSGDHVKSAAQAVIRKIAQQGYSLNSLEGMEKGEWALIDLGDLVVHIMQSAQRAHYKLEEKWG